MELTEPGLTTLVMRRELGTETAKSLALHFKTAPDISRVTGLELIVKAVPAVPLEIELEATASADPQGKSGKVTLSKTILVDTDEAEHFYIPFSDFEISETRGVEISEIRELKSIEPSTLYFTPLGETQLEIRRVAFFSRHEKGLRRTVVDGYSYETFYKLFTHVEWRLFGYDERGEWTWEFIEPSPLHPVPWDWFNSQGGTLEVIPDPTGSGRGLICRATVPPLKAEDGSMLAVSGPRREQWRGINVYRVYGSVDFEFQAAPCETSIDVWASRELVETAVTATSGVILLDIFDKSWVYDPVGHSSLQAKLWVYSVDSAGNGPYLDLKTGDQAWALAKRTPHPPVFTPEEWHTITITISPDRMARLYLDGILAAEGPLNPRSRCGTTGGHPGLYIHDRKAAYSVRGVFLIDNYYIRCCGQTER